jgi:hypothetical protein
MRYLSGQWMSEANETMWSEDLARMLDMEVSLIRIGSHKEALGTVDPVRWIHLGDYREGVLNLMIGCCWDGDTDDGGARGGRPAPLDERHRHRGALIPYGG